MLASTACDSSSEAAPTAASQESASSGPPVTGLRARADQGRGDQREGHAPPTGKRRFAPDSGRASRNGAVDLLASGVEGQKPLVTVSGLGDGEFLFAANREPVLIELEPAKFEAYLVEEGLSRIVQERASRGERQRRGRERYTRYTKALLHVGAPVTQGMAQAVLGQKLEMFVDSPERPLRVGDSVAVRVTFEGKPLAAVKLQASLRRAGAPDDPPPNAGADAASSSEEVGATTDAQGRVTLRVGSAGFLVLHLVHMRRCVESSGVPCREADWESFWGSFTTAIAVR